MATLLLKKSSPISYDKSISNFEESLENLKNQTLLNYQKLLSKTDDDDLDFYLPQLCIQMLSSVTFFNQYLLNLVLFLQKINDEKNNTKFYERNLLETIFAHTKKFRGEENFPNNLSSLSKTLFSILDAQNKDREKIKELKKISMIFLIIEDFFRHHQAHGLTNSLIDFFRGFTISISPIYIFDDYYIDNFSKFADLDEKFYFSFPTEEFNNFKSKINSSVNSLIIYEREQNIQILSKKVKDKILNLFGFPQHILDPKAKWESEGTPFIASSFFNNQEHIFLKSNIARSYFKYHGLSQIQYIKANNKELIKEALNIHEYLFVNNNFQYSKSIPISPNDLLNKFILFTELVQCLFQENLIDNI